jgi:threonine synthase
MVDDMLTLGREEGVSAAPEGAASLSAVRKLIADGRIKKHETVVLFNTGGALKYFDVLHRS